jgi:hypothetical protein
MHGFGAFSDAFTVALAHSPDAAAQALVRAVPPLVQDDEEASFECAELLSTNHVFLHNLFDFSEHFGGRQRFVQFLNGNRSGKWRTRSLMLEQSIRFVPLFGDALIETAVQFAGDPVALIRTLSVMLWTELIRSDCRRAAAVARLLESGWQTRLVAVKILREIGVTTELEAVAHALAHDPIRNVRACLAQAVQGTEWSTKLFGGAGGRDLLE